MSIFVRLDGKALHKALYGQTGAMVGRGGLEPPTSRLSGVRSNHLSYRPIFAPHLVTWRVGGAYRDRTDDLLNANQALSQLS